MRQNYLILTVLLVGGCAYPVSRSATDDAVSQAGRYEALLDGGYAGILPIGRVLERGDFGLGTFDALDGELVVLEGIPYRIAYDGSVSVQSDTVLTPFAPVKSFQPDTTIILADQPSIHALQLSLDSTVTEDEAFYAIRIDGQFRSITVRSVPRQAPPYVPLSEILPHQSRFELDAVEGTMVGFFSPAGTGGDAAPGFHFHFITTDRKRGGHVLDCILSSGSVSIDRASGFVLLEESEK